MKNIHFNLILALMIISVSSLFAANNKEALNSEIQKYNNIFERVGETRVGISEKNIIKTDNPFIQVQTKKIKRVKNIKVYFRLYAIFGNKAMINKKWVKLHHYIGSYRLIKIKQNSVLLQRKTKKPVEIYIIRKNNGSRIKISSK